jgi:hypothetical protein
MTDKVYLGILILFLIIIFFGDIKLVDSMEDVKKKLNQKKNKMKKFLIPILLLCTIAVNGQNFQLLSNGTEHIGTVELFKTLEHGHMYYFTDFKMDKNGFHEAYTEISDYWNITKTISLTAQLNGGLSFNQNTFTEKPPLNSNIGPGFHIYPVVLGGFEKTFTLGKTFNLAFDVLYRYQAFLYLPGEQQNGYQITAIFSQDLKKIQMSGYCDFWNTKYFIFEPQAWYKVFKRVWAGLEWRTSNYDGVLDTDIDGNPSGKYANYVMFGIKWNLE